MDNLGVEEYRYLRSIVRSKDDFEKRVIAHIPILHGEGISVYRIGRIYELEQNSIYIYLRYIQLFGLDGYFDHDILRMSALIEEEEYRREKILLSLKSKPGLFYYLSLPIVRLFSFIGRLSEMFTVMVAYIAALLEKKRDSELKIDNNIHIEKGATNNYILQVGTLNVTSKEVETDHLVTESKEELIEKVEELIKTNKKYDLGNDKANALFDAAQEINANPDIPQKEKNNRINGYAILIVGILIYSTTFKGGVSTISIFGVVIAVSIRSCTLFGPDVPLDTFVPNNPVLDTVVAIEESPKVEEDTVQSEFDIEPVYTVEEYQQKVPEWYELDDKCFALSAIGRRQRRFIDEYDFVEHYLEDYFIDEPDNLYYFHVVAYADIRQAAFQMNFINDRTDYNSKILESKSNNGTLYAVVIGKFKGDEIIKACQLVDSWSIDCITGENDAGYLYNGY